MPCPRKLLSIKVLHPQARKYRIIGTLRYSSNLDQHFVAGSVEQLDCELSLLFSPNRPRPRAVWGVWREQRWSEAEGRAESTARARLPHGLEREGETAHSLLNSWRCKQRPFFSIVAPVSLLSAKGHRKHLYRRARSSGCAHRPVHFYFLESSFGCRDITSAICCSLRYTRAKHGMVGRCIASTLSFAMHWQSIGPEAMRGPVDPDYPLPSHLEWWWINDVDDVIRCQIPFSSIGACTEVEVSLALEQHRNSVSEKNKLEPKLLQIRLQGTTAVRSAHITPEYLWVGVLFVLCASQILSYPVSKSLIGE